uniref:Uncharacterized protein n=1 Tax=Panagrolaimus sp. PS1159 TaxID=55785 RepID=A0AC35GFG9_9BILA
MIAFFDAVIFLGLLASVIYFYFCLIKTASEYSLLEFSDLPLEIIELIQKWIKNEKNGKEIAESFVQAAFTIIPGNAAEVAAFETENFGKVCVSQKIADSLTKYLEHKIFDLQPSMAIKDGYNYLGVNNKSRISDDELTSAFQKKAYEDFHDKIGGRTKASYCTLKAYMAIIKAKRQISGKKME